jgi:mono/diheme cytochrome c family protein
LICLKAGAIGDAYRIGMFQDRTIRLTFYAVLWIGAMACGAQAAQNIRAGRELAIDACSACHRVTPDQKPRPPVFNPEEYANVAAPAFSAIAEKYARRPLALRRFILNPVHPMPEQNWDPADLTAVVAFIQSLRHAAPAPRHGR